MTIPPSFIFCSADTDEELEEWKSKFAQRISLLDSKISRLEREMKDTDTDIPIQRKTISDCIREISRLEAEAEVKFLEHIGKLKKYCNRIIF